MLRPELRYGSHCWVQHVQHSDLLAKPARTSQNIRALTYSSLARGSQPMQEVGRLGGTDDFS